MLDEKKWNLAHVRLEAMRKSIPTYVDTDVIAEYHGIVTALEQSSGEDLSDFRIPGSKITPRVTSIQIGTRHRPGRTHYSNESYCRGEYFERQLEGLAAYLPHVHSPNTPHAPQDYDSMTDQQLENLASTYHIGGYGDAHGIDRRVIITALRERDRSLHPPAAHPAIHIANVTGSIIQQSPSHSPATLHYQAADVSSILALVKAELNTFSLTPEDRSELGVHVQTAESQLSTRRPSQVVVHECLRSARAILEGITGSLIATEIVQKITQIIGH
ncbi:MAG: hypothetical protein ACLPH3_03670 [Terracidiphilus sp.]